MCGIAGLIHRGKSANIGSEFAVDATVAQASRPLIRPGLQCTVQVAMAVTMNMSCVTKWPKALTWRAGSKFMTRSQSASTWSGNRLA